MCVIPRKIVLQAALVLVSWTWIAAASRPEAPVDPLLPFLQGDDPRARAQALELLKEEGRSPCRALAAYAKDPVSRVRESAVRTMGDAGCSDFEAYSGFLLDAAAGVVDAVIDAAQRRKMADAVPFLIGSLSDRRRIVTEEGDWSLGQRAHRALMVITCQSFHYDPSASRDDQRNALTRWRQWYLAKRALPREEWVQEGIGRGRDYAERGYGPQRLEGLRLLALIGPQALPALRELLRRGPGDVTAQVVCNPEEPPHPDDSVPCALLVRNQTDHPVAIAPPADGPVVRLIPSEAPPDESSKKPGDRPSADDLDGALAAFCDRVVDLGPGESRRFEFKAGPVLSPGRYRVRVVLDDLAARLREAAAAPPVSEVGGRGKAVAHDVPGSPGPLEAETILRFER